MPFKPFYFSSPPGTPCGFTQSVDLKVFAFPRPTNKTFSSSPLPKSHDTAPLLDIWGRLFISSSGSLSSKSDKWLHPIGGISFTAVNFTPAIPLTLQNLLNLFHFLCIYGLQCMLLKTDACTEMNLFHTGRFDESF